MLAALTIAALMLGSRGRWATAAYGPLQLVVAQRGNLWVWAVGDRAGADETPAAALMTAFENAAELAPGVHAVTLQIPRHTIVVFEQGSGAWGWVLLLPNGLPVTGSEQASRGAALLTALARVGIS